MASRLDDLAAAAPTENLKISASRTGRAGARDIMSARN